MGNTAVWVVDTAAKDFATDSESWFPIGEEMVQAAAYTLRSFLPG